MEALLNSVASYGDDFIMSTTCMCDFFDPFVKNSASGLCTYILYSLIYLYNSHSCICIKILASPTGYTPVNWA